MLLRILDEDRHTVILVAHDVEEVVHLADRVIILSERPTTIQAALKVPFAHPRKVTSAEVQELRLAILRELEIETAGV